MPAAVVDITIEQGATFSQSVIGLNTYEGWAARGQVRRGFGGYSAIGPYVGGGANYGFDQALLATFTCPNVVAGVLAYSLTAAVTALLMRPTWARGDRPVVDYGWYDLQVVSGSTVIRVQRGKVLLSCEVTQ